MDQNTGDGFDLAKTRPSLVKKEIKSMSEQQIEKPKSFLGVQPAWCLGVVLFFAFLGFFLLL
jgi:hypothetical protein